jgi:hypothetical protein
MNRNKAPHIYIYLCVWERERESEWEIEREWMCEWVCVCVFDLFFVGKFHCAFVTGCVRASLVGSVHVCVFVCVCVFDKDKSDRESVSVW